MINLMKLMKLKEAWESFQTNHPQFTAFLQAAYPQKLRAGTVLEVSVTAPDDKPLRYRMTVTDADMALFRELQETLSQEQK